MIKKNEIVYIFEEPYSDAGEFYSLKSKVLNWTFDILLVLLTLTYDMSYKGI